MKKALLLFCVFFIYASANVYVRVAHTSVKAPAVDVKVNGTVIFSDLSYPNVTSYLKVNPGFYQIEIFTHGQNTQLFNATVSLYDLQTYTFVATGDPAKGEFTVLRYADDTSNPADQYTSRIRVFHGIADVPVAEVLVDGVVVAQLNYEDVSGYLNVAGGSHLIVINQKIGTVSSKVFSINLNFNGGTVYTLFAEGLLNDSSVNDIAVAPISDAMYQYCSARVAHASPDAPAVDIFLMDLTDSVSTKIIPNLAFTQFSNYKSIAFVPTKNYSIVLTLVDKPNEVVYSFFVALQQNTVVTATAVGLITNGTNTPFHLTFTFDSIDAPKDPINATIQFFHAVPGALAATLLLDKQPLFPAISYDSTSKYVVVKRGSYTLSLFINGSTVVSKPIDVAGGTIYSVYAEGFVTNPSLQISTDASYSYTVVRVSHASPELPTFNLVLRDVHNTEVYKFNNVAYGSTTAYTTIVSQALTASLEVGTSSIYSNAVTLAPDTTNTLVVFGTQNQNFTDGLTVVAVQDTNDAPGDSKTARVRFVHAVVGGPAVDVFFNDAREFPNSVPYKGVTGYENVAEGNYKVEVKSGALSLLSFSYYFMGGAVYTIFAEGEAGAQSKVPVKAVVNQDVAYQYTTFRAVHASADAPAVDIYLDNGVTRSAVFTNLAYGSKTDYKEIVLYNYTFQVVPTGTKSAVLSTWAQFTVDTTWTAAILGLTKANTTTGLSVSFYEDDTSAPRNSLSARARFVHAVADGAPNVDVYFNDQIKFTKVAYKTATDYIDVDAKTYRIDIYVSGTHQKLASADNVAVSGGQVITLFAEGTPTAITSKVFVDFTVDYFLLRVAYTSPDAGLVNVLVEGVTIWTNVQFGQITEFVEFTSDKKNVSLVQGGNNVILQSNTPFTKNEYNTLLVVGLTEKNTTTPLEAVIVLNQPPVPSSSAVAGVRITHASPNTPAVNIQFNGTVQFSNVDYKATTQYKELTAGNYLMEANTTAGFIRANVSLHGGFAYTVFLEGLFPGVIVVPSIDYFPSPDARVRFLHTSPNTGAVDFLVNGSADIRNVEFAKNSNYIDKHHGETDFNVVPTGLLQPDLIDASFVLAQQTDYSFFFVGLSENNATNTTSTLNHFILLDDNTLPMDGLVKVRFVHTSPDAPEVDVKVNGVPVFSNVTYKGFTKYVSLTADFVDLDVVLAGKTDNLLSSRLDLRVASGSAVYTLVAEGFAHKDPALRIVSILDAGNAPPVVPTGSRSGLNGVVIGLIIGGVAVAVIIIAGIVFVLYKKKKARSGYSEIPSQQ